MSRFDGGRLGQRYGRRWRRGRCQRGDRSAQRRIGRQHAEVAVAVDARWRDKSGEAVEQLQRFQEQRAVPAWTLLGGLVE